MASYLETVADSANATEAFVGQLSMTNALADGSNATETVAEQTIARLLLDQATAVEMFIGTPAFRRLLDQATSSDALTSGLAAALRDSAVASEILASSGTYYRVMADSAKASDALRAAMEMILTDTASAADLLVQIRAHFAALHDRALATDPMVSSATVSGQLFSAALTADLLANGFSAYLTSNAAATELFLSRLIAVATMLDSATATDATTNNLRLVATFTDEALATADLTSVARLLALLESGAEASIVFSIDGEQYTAWVLNTENLATSQYINYPFNSFATSPLSGKRYGAAADGLYLLEGDDDAGTPIEAYLRTGLMDLGTGHLKRLPEAYIGYTATGDMVFKAVVVSPNGVKEEHWYRLEGRPASGTREDRPKVGKGLKSVYWQWELHNINGADFEIETVRLWPMALTRRVR